MTKLTRENEDDWMLFLVVSYLSRTIVAAGTIKAGFGAPPMDAAACASDADALLAEVVKRRP